MPKHQPRVQDVNGVIVNAEGERFVCFREHESYTDDNAGPISVADLLAYLSIAYGGEVTPVTYHENKIVESRDKIRSLIADLKWEIENEAHRVVKLNSLIGHINRPSKVYGEQSIDKVWSWSREKIDAETIRFECGPFAVTVPVETLKGNDDWAMQLVEKMYAEYDKADREYQERLEFLRGINAFAEDKHKPSAEPIG